MAPTNHASGRRRAILAAGGWMHSAGEAVSGLEPILAEQGFDLVLVEEPQNLGEEIKRGCSLFVMAACWFSMSDARYSDENRAVSAVPRDRSREKVIAELIDGGCPTLALHTAVICFDGWDGWPQRLGGAWNWDHSHHPAPEPVDVEGVEGARLSIEPFQVVDEEYRELDLEVTAEVVARSGAGGPLMWLHQRAGSRVAVDVLGHDRRSLAEPGHRAALTKLVDWLLEPSSEPDKNSVPDSERSCAI